jgi:predicted TIM-barrel fold metal-dependent hydrolase
MTPWPGDRRRPFRRPDATAIERFFDAIPDPADRAKIASGNAEALFRLAGPPAP